MDSYNQKDQKTTGAPMEQVREILFGAQLKDMEVRFKRQEERFIREIHDVKDSLKKRLDSLENFMKSEVSSLLDRLKREEEEREAAQKAEQRERAEVLANEQRERQEAIKAEERERQEAIRAEERERQDAVTRLNSDLAGAVEVFERKLAKLGNTLDAAERELRSLILNESGSLTDKIETKYADALSVVAKTAAQIRSDMVYRTALTGMFAEMVGGLSKPWNEDTVGADVGLPETSSREFLSYEEPQAHVAHDDHNHDDHHHDHHDHHDHHGGEGEHLPHAVGLGSADNY